MRETYYTVYDVVGKLIGRVEPVGETINDETVLGNVQELSELTTRLVEKLVDVSLYINRPEKSMRDVGEQAYDALMTIESIIQSRYEV